MAEQLYVEIVPYDPAGREEDDEGFRRMGPMSRWKAEKVDRGANINLNHERYYTRIVEASASSRDPITGRVVG